MVLKRTQVCALFEINSPIWGGGEKSVGLARQRVGKHNEIRFKYRRKSDGELSIPDIYYFDGDLLTHIDFKRQMIRGLELVIIPFKHLELLERE